MARLDTGWHAHPKILALSVAGMAVHAWSISYCDDALTDGFIPMGAWPSKRGFNGGIKELVAAGLWLPVQGGYQLHDFTDYNHTKAHVEAVRAAMRANGRAGGQASAAAKRQQFANQNAEQIAKQKPTPGPGPGFNSLSNAGLHAGRISRNDHPEMPATRARARARDEALPQEVLDRLNMPPISVQKTASMHATSFEYFQDERRA